MAGEPSGLADLPECFPVFPLGGALLLPHGKLPLHIFESRYRAMVEDALGLGRHIGMIQPNPTAPPGPGGPVLRRVGCLGRIASFSESTDGRFLITLLGRIRFQVAREHPLQRGYRLVTGDFTGFEDDLEPPDVIPLGQRVAILEVARAYFQRRLIDANWSALEGMDDAALVMTLCMGCPFEPLEKQALLEAPGLAERAGCLLTVLRMDLHDAPQQAHIRPS